MEFVQSCICLGIISAQRQREFRYQTEGARCSPRLRSELVDKNDVMAFTYFIHSTNLYLNVNDCFKDFYGASIRLSMQRKEGVVSSLYI